MGFIYVGFVFSIIFGITGLIASYILHSKTKKTSTLLILSANIILVTSTCVSMLGVGFTGGGSPNELVQTFFSGVVFLGALAAPLGAVGLLMYAIKLPHLNKNT